MEEWSILPTRVPLESLESILVDENYFLLNTHYENEFLVLNLESRKKFWVQKAILKELTMDKLPALDEDEEPFDRNNFQPSEITFEEMYTNVKSIKILLAIKMNNEYFGFVG